MDLLESPLFTSPIILLQTVIEEVRHRSLPLYNRLKALTRMDDKLMWIFYNEYRSLVKFIFHDFTVSFIHWYMARETAIVREEDESPNDRNDRGASFFSISVTVVTNQYVPQGFVKQQHGITPTSGSSVRQCEVNRGPNFLQ